MFTGNDFGNTQIHLGKILDIYHLINGFTARGGHRLGLGLEQGVQLLFLDTLDEVVERLDMRWQLGRSGPLERIVYFKELGGDASCAFGQEWAGMAGMERGADTS